jgi:omega-6 fatty acid desaturase (delta-12 desaturase)
MISDKNACNSKTTAFNARSVIEPGSHQRSTFLALTVFVMAIGCYAGTLFALWHAPFSLAVVLTGLNGAAIGVLFIVGHDACHGSLTRHSWLNHIVGRIAFLPALVPFSCWRFAHNYVHHGFTNIRGLDYVYVWQPLSPLEYCSLPRWQRLLQRGYRTLPGVAVYWVVEIRIRHLLFPPPSDWARIANKKTAHADRISVVAYAVGMCCLFAFWTGSGNAPDIPARVATICFVALRLIVLPFLAWSFIVGLIILVHHTSPETVWYQNREEAIGLEGQLRSTVHVKMRWPLDQLFLLIMEHHAHHVDPAIPFYNLTRQQARLEHQFADSMASAKFSWTHVHRVLSNCQLYDYDEHNWVRFDECRQNVAN